MNKKIKFASSYSGGKDRTLSDKYAFVGPSFKVPKIEEIEKNYFVL